jgi:hypothetical protein
LSLVRYVFAQTKIVAGLTALPIRVSRVVAAWKGMAAGYYRPVEVLEGRKLCTRASLSAVQELPREEVGVVKEAEEPSTIADRRESCRFLGRLGANDHVEALG